MPSDRSSHRSGNRSGDGASERDLLTTAFGLLADRGWAGWSLLALAERAELSLGDVYRQLPDRRAVLRALGERTDQAMLEIDLRELDGLPPRDKVFELIMRRLDALAPFRAGLSRLERDARRDPCILLPIGCRLERSFRYVQDLAGLRSHGLRARLQRRALLAVYLQTVRTWLADDSSDLAKTMAELDSLLRRVERVAGLRASRQKAAPDDEAIQPA